MGSSQLATLWPASLSLVDRLLGLPPRTVPGRCLRRDQPRRNHPEPLLRAQWRTLALGPRDTLRQRAPETARKAHPKLMRAPA